MNWRDKLDKLDDFQDRIAEAIVVAFYILLVAALLKYLFT